MSTNRYLGVIESSMGPEEKSKKIHFTVGYSKS